MEKGIATHSSILAWEIPWREEPGGLQSMGLQRIRHNCPTNTQTHKLGGGRGHSAGAVWCGCQGNHQALVIWIPRSRVVGPSCWAHLPVGPEAFKCHLWDVSVTSRAFLDDNRRLGTIPSYTGKAYTWGPEPTFWPFILLQDDLAKPRSCAVDYEGAGP